MKQGFITGAASLATGFCLFIASPCMSAQEHAASAQEQEKPDAATQAFLKEAAQGGMAEVSLGQLAVEKGHNEAVKNFGQRMVKDHGQANEELKNLAKSEGVTIPSDMGNEGRELQQR